MDRPWRKELQDVLAMGAVVVSVEAIVDPALRDRRESDAGFIAASVRRHRGSRP